jgi:hypothetical protein
MSQQSPLLQPLSGKNFTAQLANVNDVVRVDIHTRLGQLFYIRQLTTIAVDCYNCVFKNIPRNQILSSNLYAWRSMLCGMIVKSKCTCRSADSCSFSYVSSLRYYDVNAGKLSCTMSVSRAWYWKNHSPLLNSGDDWRLTPQAAIQSGFCSKHLLWIFSACWSKLPQQQDYCGEICNKYKLNENWI